MNNTNPYPLDLHDLRCLVTLAQELNFGRAAARLYMSQPPLTRLVAEAERTLGARLFERTTRRVRLTPVGEVLVAEARTVLSRMDGALESVQAAARRQSGRLRVAYVPLALLTVLPGMLARLRERFHDVEIDLLETPGGSQHEALGSGSVDVAFTDAAVVEGDGLSCRPVLRQPLAVVVPEGWRGGVGDSVNLADLANEPFILHPRHECPAYYDRVLAACAASGFTPKTLQRQAGQNCVALVAAGAGVLLSPATPNAATQTPGLRRLSLEVPDAASLFCEVYVAWREDHPSPYVHALVEASA